MCIRDSDYAVAVEELVRTKVEGGEVAAPTVEEEDTGEVVDLLAALSKSVDKAKASRGERTSGSGASGGSSKKSGSGKSGSGSSSKKKSTDKKPAAKKSGSKTKAS